MTRYLPKIALTIGDVSGIGPEVTLRAALEKGITESCIPVVIGHPEILREAADLIGKKIELHELDSPKEFKTLDDSFSTIYCWNPEAVSDNVLSFQKGRIDSRSGNAAYHYLVSTIELAQLGLVDGITTAPISKAALHQAGHFYPGHTEILAEKCSVPNFGMMLYLPPGERIHSPHGLGVVHVTLHTSIQSVPGLLTEKGVEEKIELIHQFMQKVGSENPRIGVCALNPHAGEEGLFGAEESNLIAPAIQKASKKSINAQGPFPADTLLKRASEGEFDGIVAMYHDQGHIAFKLLGFHQAVNVTLGLPFVRTSPSHGTAFDIAWQGKADHQGMTQAILLATKLIQSRL